MHLQIDLVADMPMNSKNKYFPSQWRRDAVACPGGFVMDSCVHHIAALRTLGRAAGESPLPSPTCSPYCFKQIKQNAMLCCLCMASELWCAEILTVMLWAAIRCPSQLQCTACIVVAAAQTGLVSQSSQALLCQ